MTEKNQVPEWKKKHVEKIVEMLEEPVVGVIELKGLPSAQFQEIKKKLRGEVDMQVSRKTLMERAIEKSDREGAEKLKEYLEGPVGIISSEKDPFILYKTLEENKSKAKAKSGKKVDKEIKVSKGPTNLQPGPVLGELQKVGLPAQIEGPNIVIKKDTTLLEPNQEITGELAAVMNTLGMKPLKIGIKIKALMEEEEVYLPKQLKIDQEEFMNRVTLAGQQALNLSVEMRYPTEQSIKPLLQKASQEARNLAIEANILTKDTIEEHMSRASSGASSLHSLLKQKGYSEKA